MKHKAVWGARIGAAIALLAALVVTSSCSEAVRQGDGSSYLVISSIAGGDANDATVESDVVGDTGTVFTDAGTAVIQVVMKDPGGPGPSPVNAITITQYRVEYVRSDGRNTPGVDVPFAFTGGTAVTISASGSGSVSFTLVRVQAKLEAPLKALAGGGGAGLISTVARITFFGRDQAGREVSVTGNIDVTFADWAG